MKKGTMPKWLLFILTISLIGTLMAGCAGGQQKKTQGSGEGTKAPQKSVQATPNNDFPTKPIQIIVPWATGGSADVTVRAIAQIAPKYSSQPFVVINRQGAGGAIGTSELVNSKPDGYTIAMTASGPVSTLMWLQEINYNVEKDIKAICGTNFEPVVLAVRGNAPYQTLDKFIAYAKGKDRILFGTSGIGGVYDLGGESLLKQKGINYGRVPFNGGAPTIAALMGGQVDVITANITELISGYKSGDFKLLAIMDEKRNGAIPDVPTFKELGYDLVMGSRKGFIVPSGTPDDVVAKLDSIIKKILQDEEFLKMMNNAKVDIDYVPGEKFRNQYIADKEIFGKIIKDIGLLKK